MRRTLWCADTQTGALCLARSALDCGGPPPLWDGAQLAEESHKLPEDDPSQNENGHPRNEFGQPLYRRFLFSRKGAKRNTHPSGMQANSRGLSASDTPGVRFVAFTPAGWQSFGKPVSPDFCDPAGVNPLCCPTEGIAKLNPRLLAVNPPGYFSFVNFVPS